MPGGTHPPLSVILHWPNPNYVDPPRHGAGFTVGITVVTALTVLTVCARLWARLLLQKNGGIDDAVITAAMVPTLGLSIMLCLASRKYGFDRHVWDIPTDVLVNGRKVVMAIEALYMVSTGLTKISILLFYRRLAAGSVSRGFLLVVYIAMFSVVAYIVTFLFTIFFNCRPINAMWNQVDLSWVGSHYGKYTCVSELGTLLAGSGVSVVQDFIACGLPSILFWKLRISRMQKVLLGSIFAVGFFICICGVLRIAYISVLYTSTYDLTWESQSIWLLTGIEANLAVICASAPALKAFFSRFLDATSFTKSAAYSWFSGKGGTGDCGPQDEYDESANTASRRSTWRRWARSDRSKLETFRSDEFAPSTFPHHTPMDIVETKDVFVMTEDAVLAPGGMGKRCLEHETPSRPCSSQDHSTLTSHPELLGPGVAFAGNYRRERHIADQVFH